MAYKPKPWTWNQGLLQTLLNRPAPPPRAPDAPTLNYADPQYIGAVAQGNLPYSQAIARFPGDVGALASNYGYTVDPSFLTPVADTPGPGDDPNDPKFLPHLNVQPGQKPITGFDTSNPYSRAALLQRSYDQTKQGNTTSYAARGQLYSGALGNAQNAAQTNFNTSSDQLRGSFNEQVRQWLSGLGGAFTGAGAARTGALGALAAQQQQNPGPTTYAGVPYAPDKRGLLTPLPGAKPTAASVLQSGSLAGTGAAGSGVYKPLKKRKK
jgi:hypothetical protein